MKKDRYREKISSELNFIIVDLIDNAIETEDEIYWNTLVVGIGFVDTGANETIYKGNSGILLFFLEVFRNIPDQRYRNIIEKSCKWLWNYCEANSPSSFAFYTGRMGVAFTFLKVYELLEDETYLIKAQKIAENCNEMIDAKSQAIDLINGASGTLLILLHIYYHTPNQNLLQQIRNFTIHILKNLHLDNDGIYFQRENNQIKGLCGLSHGSSGVGWVIMEAGRLFNDQNLIDLSYQTIYYENAQFKKEYKNWPDFRKDLYDESSFLRYKSYYKNGHTDMFLNPNNMIAWCHGAPGIGFNRIRFHDVTDIKIAKHDFKRALSITKKDLLIEGKKPVHILCHGTAGNAMLFIEAHKQSNNSKYLTFARRIANDIINNRQQEGLYYSGYSAAGSAKDYSLFMGNAGIAYFFLSCLYPINTNSYQLPFIKKSTTNFTPFLDSEEINHILIKTKFPNSFNGENFENFSKNLYLGKKKLFAQLETIMLEYTKGTSKYECLKLEIKACKYEHRIRSTFYDYIKLSVRKEDLEINIRSSLEIDWKVISTSENIIFGRYNGDYSTYYLVINVDPSGRKFFFVNEITFSILQKLKTPMTIAELKSDIIKQLQTKVTNNLEIRKFLDFQVKELLKAGFIYFRSESQ